MHKIDVSELKGPLGELFDQLSGADGRSRFEEFKLWQKGVVPGLLQPVTVVSVAGAKRFIAREQLKSANVGWTGENFKGLFLDKVEENVPAGQVAVHTLVKGSLDPEIITELGRTRRVILLAHFFQLLEKQADGQSGPLLTSSVANIGYIFDIYDFVWAVIAYWDSFSRYWYVDAYSVGSPSDWSAGHQVLSQAT